MSSILACLNSPLYARQRQESKDLLGFDQVSLTKLGQTHHWCKEVQHVDPSTEVAIISTNHEIKRNKDGGD